MTQFLKNKVIDDNFLKDRSSSSNVLVPQYHLLCRNSRDIRVFYHLGMELIEQKFLYGEKKKEKKGKERKRKKDHSKGNKAVYFLILGHCFVI